MRKFIKRTHINAKPNQNITFVSQFRVPSIGGIQQNNYTIFNPR